LYQPNPAALKKTVKTLVLGDQGGQGILHVIGKNGFSGHWGKRRKGRVNNELKQKVTTSL